MRAAYCGKTCQRLHWKAAVDPHKAECKAVAASNNSATEHEPVAPWRASSSTSLPRIEDIPDQGSIARLRRAAAAGDSRAQLELGIVLFNPGPYRDLDGSEAVLRRFIKRDDLPLDCRDFGKLQLSMTLSVKACIARETDEMGGEEWLQEAERLVMEADIPEAHEIRRGSEPWHTFCSAKGLCLCFFPGSSVELQEACVRERKEEMQSDEWKDAIRLAHAVYVQACEDIAERRLRRQRG